jgi:hypothetical protein
MNAKRITLRSLVRRRVCFGGFRRRTWRDHGLCPWGSILSTSFLVLIDACLPVGSGEGAGGGEEVRIRTAPEVLALV